MHEQVKASVLTSASRKKILIASDGEDILAPSFLRSNMQALKRASKTLSKKKFGSKKRENVMP